MPEALYDTLLKTCGISSIFADAALRRALKRLNIEPAQMTKDDLKRALPDLRAIIRSYLHDDADPFIKAVDKLAA